MLKIYTGAHGSGKTTAFLREMGALAAQNQGKQFYIVPELFSHEFERLLASTTQNQGGRTAEVVSFTRFAHMVFAQTGGAAQITLDSAGRLLTLQQAVTQVSAGLRHYRGLGDRPAVVRQVLEVLDEMKTCCVTPQDLFDACAQIQEEQPRIAEKLLDLATIATAYDRLCAQTLPDPREALDRLATQLPDWQSDCTIYIDAFRSFTAQEMRIVHVLLRRGYTVHIALTLEHDQPDLYYSAHKTWVQLRKFAQKNDIAFCEVPCTHVPDRPQDLQLLCAQGLALQPTPTVVHGGAVHLVRAHDPYTACEHAAATILRIKQQTGARWRDFVVASRNGQDDTALLEIAMERYQIPMYHSETDDVLQKPPMLLLRSALAVVTENFPYHDLFACLKTGLCNLSQDEVDALEIYALKWQINGGAWLRDWTMHPAGYGLSWDDDARAQLAQLNQLRARAIAPFATLRDGLRTATTATQSAQVLFAFLEQQDTAQQMEARAVQQETAGRAQQAQQYRQLWDIIVGALEQCAWVCGDQPMSIDRFAGLFTLILSEYQVGTIPVSLDRVNCGAMTRVCAFSAPYVIMLGCNEGSLPQIGESTGILSEDDRAYLEGAGVELTAYGEQRLGMELELVCDLLACPSREVFFITNSTAPDGTALRPSYLVENWRKLLVGVDDYQCDPLADALLSPLPRQALAHAALGGMHDRRAHAVLLEQVLSGQIAMPQIGSLSHADTAYQVGVYAALRTGLAVYATEVRADLGEFAQQAYLQGQAQVQQAVQQALQLPATLEQQSAPALYCWGDGAGRAVLQQAEICAAQYTDQPMERLDFEQGYREGIRQALSAPVQPSDSALYGNPVRLTASRVDTFYRCPFSYFMQYGMQAKAQKSARFSAPEAGTFIHYILEHLVQVLTAQTTLAQAMQQLHQICEQYIDTYLGGMQDKPARFRTQFYRLRDSLKPVVESMLFELQNTEFVPIDLELDFSPHGDLPPVTCTEGQTTVALSGKVDRVDGYIQGDKLYVRVMDYKSGKKAFSLSDLWYGLNLQLMIYLYALREDGLQRYCDKLQQEFSEIVPAGVLYVPVREPVLDAEGLCEDNTLAEMRLQALCRSGLVTDNMDILHAMEQGTVGKSKLLPFTMSVPKHKKDEPEGEMIAKGALANLEQFGRLARHARKKLVEMGQQLQQGAVPCRPASQQNKMPCDYCDYAAACHFDPSAGDQPRVLTPLKDQTVWDCLQQSDKEVQHAQLDN